MFLLRLLFKNAFRHRLRTVLTMVGLVVAICAFGLLRTIVDAWYAGVEGSSSTRLIVRSNISLTFPLPLNYAQRLRAVEGVRQVSWSNWFGGVYITERNFFPQFAVDPAKQAAWTKWISYGPAHPDAYKTIDAATAKKLPTAPENFKTAIKADATYWAKNKDKVTERFEAWLLS